MFFLISAQNKQTHYTYVWRHKDVKAQCEDHDATHLPRLLKSHTHEQNTSSKTYPNGCNC